MRILSPLIARSLVLGLAALAAATAARAGDEDFQIIMGYEPPEASCTAENTESVSMSALLKAPEARYGKCVSTEGYVTARALFVRKTDLDRRYPASNRYSAGRRIGLYGSDKLMAEIARRDWRRVRVTGLFYDCADLGAAGDLVLGYCHYAGGPFIGMTSVDGRD
jgi:hypothetical protein